MSHNWFGVQGNGYSFRWQCIHCKTYQWSHEDIRPSIDIKIRDQVGNYLTCDEIQVRNVQNS